MSELRVTLIDVGWGDSIFIESLDQAGRRHLALVDSNDTTYLRSSYIFLKRHFERIGVAWSAGHPVFEFVLLTHGHTDHGQGLKAIMKAYGAERFWYPKSTSWSSQANLISYANRSSKVKFHQAVDESKILPSFGDVAMKILWPRYDDIQPNENNNSVVLALTLDQVTFLLTGDAEEEAWAQMYDQIPANTRMVKVPHHGSVNGTLDSMGNPTWPEATFDQDPVAGISSHLRPHSHPDPEVISELEGRGWQVRRTDLDYHLTFITDGHDLEVKYSHV